MLINRPDTHTDTMELDELALRTDRACALFDKMRRLAARAPDVPLTEPGEREAAGPPEEVPPVIAVEPSLHERLDHANAQLDELLACPIEALQTGELFAAINDAGDLIYDLLPGRPDPEKLARARANPAPDLDDETLAALAKELKQPFPREPDTAPGSTERLLQKAADAVERARLSRRVSEAASACAQEISRVTRDAERRLLEAIKEMKAEAERN